MIRVLLPLHLRTLAKTGEEVRLDVAPPVTTASVLDALEAAYPMLRGTVRGHGRGPRRAFVRFYVAGEDWSHEPVDAELPAAVADGSEPLRIVGAMAGG